MREFLKKTVAMLIGVVVALVLLELACQAFYAFYVTKKLTAQQQDPLHYYQPSEDPVLVYELKPGYSIEKDGRRIHINANGIRDDEDQTHAPRRIAILGDSVPFGTALSQEETLPAALQRLSGDSVKVLNFGTPGYGLEEISRFLEIHWPQYRPQKVVYLLNLNDYSRRNTVYEGADNGLYRIYKKPFLKMPFLIRKAIYRMVKGGQMSSVAWYRWLYEGNKKEGLAEIEKMKKLADEKGFEFEVVLFPPAVAYSDGFQLEDVAQDLENELDSRGIPFYAPIEVFSENTAALQDNTDHMTPEGCEKLAQWMNENL
ncbi:MAG: hypothetical protein Kow0027_02370 [Saprospiraceae bacterium]